MRVTKALRAAGAKLRHDLVVKPKFTAVLLVGVAAAGLSVGLAEAAVRVQALRPLHVGMTEAAVRSEKIDPAAAPPVTHVVWEGKDLDGDGQPDVANPTGQAPRGEDAFGEGRFHAARDGGAREHEGVDYVATAGQPIGAPISGYVAKIGYAYPDDQSLRFVEIENPALHLTARVFYVDPKVAVGDSVAIGHPIGSAHSLQRRYHGITDHVHLELADGRGRKLDAQTMILARAETDTAVGD